MEGAPACLKAEIAPADTELIRNYVETGVGQLGGSWNRHNEPLQTNPLFPKTQPQQFLYTGPNSTELRRF